MDHCDDKQEHELWLRAKEQFSDENILLGQKMSFTVRHSLIGLLFILARYKFPAKMLRNKKKVKLLDLGCHDGLGDWLIAQNCDIEKLVGIDFDNEAITWAKNNVANEHVEFIEGDFLGREIFSSKMGGGL